MLVEWRRGTEIMGEKKNRTKKKVELVPSRVRYVQHSALLGGLAALVIRTRGQQAKRNAAEWLSELQTQAPARKMWTDFNQ